MQKKTQTAFSEILKDVNPEDIKSIEDLPKLPVLRKSELVKLQSENPPLGGTNSWECK